MPPHKRNRSSATFLRPEEANGAMNTPRNTGSPPDDGKPEPLYRIEILRDVNSTPKSKGKKGAKKIDYTKPKDEPAIAPEKERVTYTILPGSNWESMKKYKNFIVGKNTFGIHDFVYVNNEEGHRGNEQGDDEDEDEDDDGQKGWVAFVLEIRAKSSNHVYLRVFWMYRPRDLPAGRLHYHGHSELIASNHMDIIDAMTVIDEAQVMHMREEDDEPAVEGLYWRQTLNVINGKLSPLRRACVCNDYHNPDKLLLQCSNEGCKLWLHQDCIVKHALGKAMARVSIEDDSGSGSTNEASGTIKVAQSSRRGIKLDEIQPSPSKGSIRKSNTGKRRRGSKSKSKPKEASYEGKLMGVVETRPKLNDEETSQETTGKLIVTDLRGDGHTTSKIDMICPKCEELLAAQ